MLKEMGDTKKGHDWNRNASATGHLVILGSQSWNTGRGHDLNIYFYVFILLHRFLRGVAYREFTQLLHGFLGGKRIPLPACAYHAIRTELSEENKEFVGFEDNE